MQRHPRLTLVLIVLSVVSAMTWLAQDSHAYVEAPMSLGAVVTQSTNIVLMRVESVDKDSVLQLLAKPTLSPIVRNVLELRQEAARSSTSKLRSMLDRAGSDDRLRYTLQYHGAGPGRWTARGVQVHNFPRPLLKQKDVEWICDVLGSHPIGAAYAGIEMMYGDPMTAIPSCLDKFFAILLLTRSATPRKEAC